MSTFILGLDPSTKTGIALLQLAAPGDTRILINRELTIKEGITGLERALRIRDRVEEALREACEEYNLRLSYDNLLDLAVIEGYGYANKHTLVPMVEIGTMLRTLMMSYQVPYEEVAPTALKKFVTGKGNSKKEDMMFRVESNWGVKCANDNAADAVGLAFYGAWLLDLLTIPESQIPLKTKKKGGKEFDK